MVPTKERGDRISGGCWSGCERVVVRAEVRREHLLDPRGAGAALEPRDGALVLDEDERRHELDLELLGELGPLVDVDARDSEPVALLAGEVREQALHPASGAGALAREEDEQGPCGLGHWSVLLVVPGPRQRGDVVCSRFGSRGNRHYTGARVGLWYWIGVCAGLGAAVGVLAVALLRDVRIALPVARAAGGAAGWVLEEWSGAVAAGVGGALGAFGASPTVRGALARGGTRAGTALLVGAAALALAALSLVPILGYLIALAVPVLGVRLRRRQSERHAGLRILARD